MNQLDLLNASDVAVDERAIYTFIVDTELARVAGGTTLPSAVTDY